jgi:hypothetical protein
MYVAKFDRAGMLWKVTLLEKRWSDQMLSNEITELKTKKFWMHHNAYRWIEREVSCDLFHKHQLEIIDG